MKTINKTKKMALITGLALMFLMTGNALKAQVPQSYGLNNTSSCDVEITWFAYQSGLCVSGTACDSGTIIVLAGSVNSINASGCASGQLCELVLNVIKIGGNSVSIGPIFVSTSTGLPNPISPVPGCNTRVYDYTATDCNFH